MTRFSVSPQDAGFVTKREDDVLRTSAATFRPIDVKQGPDGALYIADWSNPIINHGEVDFRDERRDRWHGRIWRLRWKGAKPKKTQDLTKQSVAQLLNNLKSDDRYHRDQSRRVLIERGHEVSAEATQWTQSQTDDFVRLQGLWLGQALDADVREIAKDMLATQDAGVRAAVYRILADLMDPESDAGHLIEANDAVSILQRGVNDEHPRVRLEAVRALGRLGTFEAASLALQALNHPRDRFIDFAVATTLDELTDPFMTALDSGKWTANTPEREQQLEFVLSSIQPVRAAAYLSTYLANNEIQKDGTGPWIDLIGKAGGAAELSKLFSQAINGGFDRPTTERALQSLAGAQRLRKKRPSGNLNAISTLLDSSDERVRIAAISLTGNWKLTSQVKWLGSEAEKTTSSGLREAAIEALREIGKPAVDELIKLAQSNQTDVRNRATIALGQVAPTLATGYFFKAIAEIEDEAAALSLWRGFLAIKDGGKFLMNDFPEEGVSQVAARAGLLAAKDGGRNEPKLVAALTPMANMEASVQGLTPQRIAALVKKVESDGDAARGESVYSRASLACINCHAIGGVGGKVGPDMTSLGASAPLDYLVESIYEPNAKIKENYHSVIVATEDGQVFAGIEVEETDDELVIRAADNRLIRIPQDDVIAKKAGESLMPTGVVDRLSEQEQVDLLKFLSLLGKPGQFDASKGGVGRVYEVLAGTRAIEREDTERVINGERTEGWKLLWSRVNGDVPGVALTQITKPAAGTELASVYLRTGIEVAQDGEVTLSTTGVDKVALWIDGEKVEGEAVFSHKLAAGSHKVLIRLDGKSIPTKFRLVSRDVTFAAE